MTTHESALSDLAARLAGTDAVAVDVATRHPHRGVCRS